MSRKLTRLALAASVAAGFTVAPMLGAFAADRYVDASGQKFSGKVENGKPPTTDALPNDTVYWRVLNGGGEHTVTPKNDEPKPGGGTYHTWPAGVESSPTLENGDEFYVTFSEPGLYFFYCKIHAGMTGVIDVKDQNPSTDPPPPPPPTTSSSTTTTTTRVAVPGPTTTTSSAPASSAGAKPSVTTAPKPTTTTAKEKKGKDDKKEEETTTTTLPPPPPPIDLPASAIVPELPGSMTGTTTQNGIEAPGDTPEGDAIALLKPNKGGGKAMKLLIVSGLGLGVLGIGTAGYKYANRSSKYFPA